MNDMRDDKQVKPRILKGRAKITTPYEYVDETNLIEVLNDTLSWFACNKGDIRYLWDYYKGVQPILHREKDVRPEICNKIVENHAQEIVAFKVGYQLAEPLQYTCRNSTEEGYEERLEQINELNNLMFAEDKASADRDLFEWLCVCGLGYRFIEADTEKDVEEGGAPFEIYTLDPRMTYTVQSAAYHGRTLMGVWVSLDVDKKTVYNIYTDDTYYRVIENTIVEVCPHTYGRCPIVEYQLNNARMGVFEPALPLLDALNNIESNRLDGVEQTVQSLMKFINCDITEDGFTQMLKLGAIKIDSRDGVAADVDIIQNTLDQSQTEVTKNDIYDAVMNICGMPKNTSTSGGDTGAAVLLRDGWTMAESHAKSFELQLKKAERNALRVVLNICKQTSDCDIDLRIRDIELVFNRRNYENIQVKAQVLTTMLSSTSIHPELAFQACGLFSDPDAAYAKSMEYKEECRQFSLETFTPMEEGTDNTGEGDGKAENEPKKEQGFADTPQPASEDNLSQKSD